MPLPQVRDQGVPHCLQARLTQPERLGQGRGDQGRLLDGGQRHENGAVVVLTVEIRRDLEREAGLAHPTGTR